MINTKLAISRRKFNLQERASLLDGSVWGQDLSWFEVEHMANYFDVHDYAPDIIIMKEGSKRDPYIGLIISGTVNIIKEDIQGHQKILTHIGKGKTFGEMSVIDGLSSSATVITTSDVLLMTLEKKNFHRLIVDNPTLGSKFLFKLLKIMSARIRETSGKLIDFVDP